MNASDVARSAWKMLKSLPANAPAVAETLHRAGEHLHTAAGAVGVAMGAHHAATEFAEAFKERRIQIDLGDGRIGVRIRPRSEPVVNGRVRF